MLSLQAETPLSRLSKPPLSASRLISKGLTQCLKDSLFYLLINGSGRDSNGITSVDEKDLCFESIPALTSFTAKFAKSSSAIL